MRTLPIESDSATPNARILVVGRSETVLADLVAILRHKGYAAGASNEFDRIVDLFDIGQVDAVVFGGMVPPGTKADLREQISTRNPCVAFIQGYAGIPGLIAEQVDAALHDDPTGSAAAVTYDARTRSIGLALDELRSVTVTAWWHTSFVPPEPRSTAQVILDGDLPAGTHAIAIPDRVPTRASFATVSVGGAVHTFIVGPMPTGTTLAPQG